MGTLTLKCQTDTLVVLLCFPKLKNLFSKMNKFALTFVVVATLIAGSIEAARIPGCKLRGDVSSNLLKLRFNQDSDFTCMKRLLQKGADVNAKDSYDYTSVMYAAKGTSSKALDVVKYLVNKGAQLNAKNYYNNNALQLAVLADNGNIVKHLIEKGAEGELSDLLMLAVRYGKELTKSVKVLVNKGANVNKVSGPTEYPYINDTILIIAAQNDYMEIVKTLLEKGANFNVRCHSRSWCVGKDTMIYAANFGNLDVIQLLLSKGANKDVQDKIGNTPLMMAARNGEETVAQFLLDQGANVNLINDKGYSALTYAYEQGHENVFELLKAHGAYPVDFYIFNFANLFPSYISDPIQKLRRTHRENHGN